MQKILKKQKKTFATLQTQLEEQADSDITDSEDGDDAQSHFQQHVFLNKHAQVHNNVQKDHTLNMQNVILLDNESTMDLFCNESFVTGVMRSKHSVHVTGNGGTLVVKRKATLNGYHAKVWFHAKAITNILALANVKKQYRVTYDSGDDKGFVVHRSQHGMPDMRFELHKSGLHIYNPKQEQLTFLQTVQDKMEGFTKRQVIGAQQARNLYAKLAYPSIKDFEWAVISNQIQDCPVTKNDIEVAQLIWGKDVSALKGKTVRSNAPGVKGITLSVPKEFMKLNKDVLLTMDLFFVNKIVFFLTLSRKIDFTAVNHLSNKKASTIFKAFKEIYKYYLQRGFRITEIHADNEFGALQALIQDMPRGPRINLVSADEHVPEIERRIRVVKERTRAMRHGLPFDRLPKLMTIHIVLNVVKLLTYFPTKSSMSTQWSPRMIMAGKPLNFKKDLALEFAF
jgi:hypothetical protein